MKNNTQILATTALMTAVLCILGPFSVPIGMVPVSFTNMAIYFVIIVLGKKRATISVALYLLIGFAGLPVFSGFSGGAGRLLGPTGGYLLGYLILSFAGGGLAELFHRMGGQNVFFGRQNGQALNKKAENWNKGLEMLALLLGTLLLYLFGTLWLMVYSGLDMRTAFLVGVAPFFVFDLGKIGLAVVMGNRIKKRMEKIEG